MEITDTVSVMRRGEMTATVKTADTNPQELAELMVGRKVLLRVNKAPANPGANVLEVENLRMVDENRVERLKGISLNVRAGEILGIAGVSGNGQTQLLEVLGGYAAATGEIRVNGDPIDLTGYGLIMDFPAWQNMVFGYHHAPEYQKNRLLMDNAAMIKSAQDKLDRFDVRPPNPQLDAKSYSGGNQQKIVVAREIERNPDLLLVGQPTRGVDIGAIEFIHKQLISLRDQGKAVLLVSVELEEILSLSDRIAVMFDGQIMGERLPDQTNERELGLLMAGVAGKGDAA